MILNPNLAAFLILPSLHNGLPQEDKLAPTCGGLWHFLNSLWGKWLSAPLSLLLTCMARKYTFGEARVRQMWHLFVDMAGDVPFHTTHEMSLRK